MTPLIAALAEMTNLAQDVLWQGFVVFLRVGAAMALLPAFGDQSVPQRLRLVLALAFTAIVAPAVVSGLPAMADAAFPLLLGETVIGVALGLTLRLFVHALQIAGAIAAQATSLTQVFAAAGPEPQPAIGHLLIFAGLALAVAGGLHLQIARFLIFSYDMLPAGHMPSSADLSAWELGQIAHAFSLAFSLAAPFVIAAFLYNLALGIINRAMPQLMVTFIGAPALSAGGLVLLVAAAPLALAAWLRALEAFFSAPFGSG